MPLHTADALILRTYKLGESDRIVVFLTRDRGKKRGVAKNARVSRKRFGGALEPMTCGRVGYMEWERRELVLLQYVEPTCSPLGGIPGQPGTPGNNAAMLGYVSYFAELLDECAPDANPSETLFRLGSSVVEAMVSGVPADPLARYFEYWVLRLQGVYQTPPELSYEARLFLDTARASSPVGLAAVSVSRRALEELAAAHQVQIALHLEKDLKSVRVLREMSR